MWSSMYCWILGWMSACNQEGPDSAGCRGAIREGNGGSAYHLVRHVIVWPWCRTEGRAAAQEACRGAARALDDDNWLLGADLDAPASAKTVGARQGGCAPIGLGRRDSLW